MRSTCVFLTLVLGLCAVHAPAQMGDYKDPYKAEQNGKAMAPAAALGGMLSMFEFQAMKAAEAMPADQYDFTPNAATFAAGSAEKFAGVRSFAQQVGHLAQANYFLFGKLNGAAMPPAVKTISTMKTKDELLTALKQSFTFAHAQIATITTANAFTGIEGADGLHTPTTLAAFGVAHGYDHYGQMVEYLRMNGILPFGSK